MPRSNLSDRRRFLKYLAASPYIASFGGVAAFLEQGGIFAQQLPSQDSKIISNPSRAIDVFDFEEPAHRRMLPGHWSYMVSGSGSDETLRANREGFNHVQLNPSRLRDVTKIDMKISLFGTTYDSPIFTCPTGGERNVWLPDGELSVARAAKARGTLQMLSNATSNPVEDVNKALGRPVWMQLYVPPVWENCQRFLERVAAAECPVVVVTADLIGGRTLETDLRTRPEDLSTCESCHKGPHGSSSAMNKGFNTNRDLPRLPVDWAYLDRIRQFWKGKLAVKGILRRDDAAKCIEHGVDMIHVSNHGGRSTESLRSTIETLPEIVAEVRGRVPVFVDSGFRHGVDVFKALALGATAVGIGRPMLWGLGAFGQPGVERVLEILQSELRMAMANCGTPTLASIDRSYVITRDWKS